jgi:predicted nucleic acid-binding protein
VTRAAIDTGALLALASSRDQYHARAVATETRFRRGGGRWVGSTLVLGELHGHLVSRIAPDTARRTVSALLADPAFEWHAATTELLQGAIDRWLTRFADQAFSLTDAVTFELMRRERLSAAFAYDKDFGTAGFELLD